MPTRIATAKAQTRPSTGPPVERMLVATMAPETPVPSAVPSVSERLRALVAAPWASGGASRRTISDSGA